MKKELRIYLVIVALTALAMGLSGNLISNFFKDAYHVSAYQRGVLEFPRELPGIITVLVLGLLSFWNDIRVAMIAQFLSLFGIFALGLWTPGYEWMMFYIFVNSMGMHMFFILQDSIGMRLVPQEELGKRLGQFKGLFTAFQMVAALIAYLGFKMGWMRFDQPLKWSFVFSGFLILIVFILLGYLNKLTKWDGIAANQDRFIWNWKYKYFYMLVVLFGMQKQIMMVYGPWVLIDLLNKKADTISILGIVGSFAGIFFMPALGKWIDKYGVKRLLYWDAWSYILVYIVYGIICIGFIDGWLPSNGIGLFIAYTIFIVDRMSTQMGMIRTVYLKKIVARPSDLTPTLSMGQSLDHVVSIAVAFIGGILWTAVGPQYVFFLTALLSLINLYVAKKVDPSL